MKIALSVSVAGVVFVSVAGVVHEIKLLIVFSAVSKESLPCFRNVCVVSMPHPELASRTNRGFNLIGVGLSPGPGATPENTEHHGTAPITACRRQ